MYERTKWIFMEFGTVISAVKAVGWISFWFIYMKLR